MKCTGLLKLKYFQSERTRARQRYESSKKNLKTVKDVFYDLLSKKTIDEFSINELMNEDYAVIENLIKLQKSTKSKSAGIFIELHHKVGDKNFNELLNRTREGNRNKTEAYYLNRYLHTIPMDEVDRIETREDLPKDRRTGVTKTKVKVDRVFTDRLDVRQLKRLAPNTLEKINTNLILDHKSFVFYEDNSDALMSYLS